MGRQLLEVALLMIAFAVLLFWQSHGTADAMPFANCTGSTIER